MVGMKAAIEIRMLCVGLLYGAFSMPAAGQSPPGREAPPAGDRPRAAFKLSFSTFLSGSGRANGARAVAVDAEGNIYVSGGTSSPDFPTTPGAYSRKFDGSGTSAGNSGPVDAYVTKLTADGKMVWSTLVGGPNHDRTYSIRVDRKGCVYIAGPAGEGFPTTPGVVQEKFAGDTHPPSATVSRTDSSPSSRPTVRRSFGRRTWGQGIAVSSVTWSSTTKATCMCP